MAIQAHRATRARDLGIIGVMLFFACQGLAAPSVKLGYVDLQRALQETSVGQKAKSELEAEFKRKKKELEQRESDLKKQREDIAKKKDLLSEKALQQKAAEFQQKMLQYREQLAKSQMEIQKRERELTAPILKDLGGLINEIAKAKGYDMIFEKSQQGIVWAKSSLDLTKQLIESFEKKQKKAKKSK